MEYIDRDGNRHKIPLYGKANVKISPDADNALYESPNGLKVDKNGSGDGDSSISASVTISGIRMTTIEVPIDWTSDPTGSSSQYGFSLRKVKILEKLNLKEGEHILGGDDAANFIKVHACVPYYPITNWDMEDKYSTSINFYFENPRNLSGEFFSVFLTYLIFKAE